VESVLADKPDQGMDAVQHVEPLLHVPWLPIKQMGHHGRVEFRLKKDRVISRQMSRPCSSSLTVAKGWWLSAPAGLIRQRPRRPLTTALAPEFGRG
jgi:hypothetical protein